MKRRYQFLRWLNKNVAKTPEGTVSPRWIMWVHAILFPLHAAYAHQAQVRYDVWKNTYTIQGIELSGHIFFVFNDPELIGTPFTFTNDNGIITIKKIEE